MNFWATFFHVLGAILEFRKQKCTPGLVILYQLEQLDDVVTGMVAHDLCHYATLVRILQFSHRHFPLSLVFSPLEPKILGPMVAFAEKCIAFQPTLRYLGAKTMANSY